MTRGQGTQREGKVGGSWCRVLNGMLQNFDIIEQKEVTENF